MVRSELIKKVIEENPHLKQSEVTKIVDTIFSEITSALARKDRVELRGFGVFEPRTYEAHTGRNPRTGEPVEVEEKTLPFFKAGKLMRDRLNGR